ncbi:MAG: anti-sigma factor antagonist [Solirubrobacteraceae bacterium]|jgi:anti-anti-sigma factor|nr:anti-sigma factor antagonist [Solirubrobacteraceae bacterium]
MRLEHEVTDDPALADELRPRGPVQLTITEQREDAQLRLVLGGELDILTAVQFSAHMDEIVRRGHGDVAVDLRSLRFVDSAGLHILLNSQRRLIRGGRRLTVWCRPGPVARAIQLARLSETLGLRDSP